MISKTELYHCWKKYKAMKDKKNLEVLLKATQKFYDKNQRCKSW